jgi:hypothetical protein
MWFMSLLSKIQPAFNPVNLVNPVKNNYALNFLTKISPTSCGFAVPLLSFMT